MLVTLVLQASGLKDSHIPTFWRLLFADHPANSRELWGQSATDTCSTTGHVAFLGNWKDRMADIWEPKCLRDYSA